MPGRTPPFFIKGVPAPFLITPRTDAEVACGIPTLIAESDLDVLIEGIRKVAPERTDLVEKFEGMKR